MSFELSIVGRFAQEKALSTQQLFRNMLSHIADCLIDAGAAGVSWKYDNVHGQPLSQGATPEAARRAGPHQPFEAGRTSDFPYRGPVQTILQQLYSARRALEKKELIAIVNAQGIGINATRTGIEWLVQAGVLREFSVPRSKRRSAIFVALIVECSRAPKNAER